MFEDKLFKFLTKLSERKRSESLYIVYNNLHQIQIEHVLYYNNLYLMTRYTTLDIYAILQNDFPFFFSMRVDKNCMLVQKAWKRKTIFFA